MSNTSGPPHPALGRLDSLDGLRAFAIAVVMLFHYTVRWVPPTHSQSLYPYGDALGGFLPSQYGWLGVQLFFIISGFVITLTLQRCTSLLEFAARRYSRLAPTMLLCAITTYAVISAFPGAPFPVSPFGFIPSLTFLDPQDLNLISQRPVFGSIDTAYWSLFVEVKFYLVSGLVFFLCKTRFNLLMCAIVLLGTAAHVVRIPAVSGVLDRVLIPLHMPWFVFGVGFYFSYKGEATRKWLPLLGCGVVSLLTLEYSGRSNTPVWAIAALPLLFHAALNVAPVRKLLALRPLVIAGAASYSCYLLHQYIGVTLLHSLPNNWNNAVVATTLVITLMAAMSVYSILSFRLLETPATHWLLRKLLSMLGAKGRR
jgi:peptidoglycan/LPS O-acetylase OafA/YrhL